MQYKLRHLILYQSASIINCFAVLVFVLGRGRVNCLQLELNMITQDQARVAKNQLLTYLSEQISLSDLQAISLANGDNGCYLVVVLRTAVPQHLKTTCENVDVVYLDANTIAL